MKRALLRVFVLDVFLWGLQELLRGPPIELHGGALERTFFRRAHLPVGSPVWGFLTRASRWVFEPVESAGNSSRSLR